MALPRQGSRVLVVDGIRYRTISDLPDDMIPVSERVVSFIVQRDDGPGARLRATIGWATVVREYRAIGKGASKRYDRAPPFVVAQAIRIAQRRGWQHDRVGPEHDLGHIDELIDWSGLTSDSADRRSSE